VEACEAELGESILRGSLAAGSKLPSEREMAAELGVSRLTLRSALARLAGAGLVTAEHGRGYFVRDYRESGGPSLLTGLAALAQQDGRSQLLAIARDLLIVRRGLARAVLERLADASHTQWHPIRLAVMRFEELVLAGMWPSKVADADMEVLGAILESTESPVLRLCHNPVVEVVRRMEPLRRALYAEPEKNLQGYKMLIDWLASPPKTRRATIEPILAELARRDEATLERLARARVVP
jgi:DNA-binding FadR family transcriptional regulator